MTPRKLIFRHCCDAADRAVPAAWFSSQQRRALTADQQKNTARASACRAASITGHIRYLRQLSVCGLDLAVHTNDREIGNTELHSPFPDFYKPTIKELLDTIAFADKILLAYTLTNRLLGLCETGCRKAVLAHLLPIGWTPMTAASTSMV
jgi:hypothetical protein